MKTFLITLVLLMSFIGHSQIKKIAGNSVSDKVTITEHSFDETLILGYVANGVRIQEFKNHELVDVLEVTKVIFYTDKIFYEVKNSSGSVFGVTFTFEDRSIFFSDETGDFVEFSGEGLTFAHQY